MNRKYQTKAEPCVVYRAAGMSVMSQTTGRLSAGIMVNAFSQNGLVNLIPFLANAAHPLPWRYYWSERDGDGVRGLLNEAPFYGSVGRLDLQGRRLAIIGGAGFIGSQIVGQLLEGPVAEVIVVDNFVRGKRSNLQAAGEDPRLKILSGSIKDAEFVRDVLADVDGVFLLASLWLDECVQDPRTAWEVNVLGTWNVVEACRDLGVQRIVYSSSASVYGNPVFTPISEDHPFSNRTTYGATKIACEQMLRAIHDQTGLPFVGLRYMNVYGPRMDYKGVYVSVIMKVLDCIFDGQRPVIFGDGSQVFDFVYVDDVARANILAMKSDCVDEFLNVGTGVGASINEVTACLLELTGSNLLPDYRPTEKMFVTYRIGTTEKAKRLIGFEPTCSLRQGLQRVVEWRLQERGCS